ncbi:hypothetical protein ACIBFB_07180 [Nocardiopsis sp. NPDC050513]|uniref:hypothetical protein n=1 Tax=Nocardiopsis sp. NPDC050513 TaxID=3364338 RepID=UPI00379EE61F
MDPLQLVMTLGSAFISATSVLVASVALGARWEGRSESDRELADAKAYEMRVMRDPRVTEVRYLEALLSAYDSAHKPVDKDLERRTQLVSRAESEAQTRARFVQTYLETLRDYEQVSGRVLDHDRTRGVRGVLRSARRGLTRPFRGERAPGPATRSGKGVRM